MAEKNLTAKDILQKEFTRAMRGYNTAEVDSRKKSLTELEKLEYENMRLKIENERLIGKVDELTKQLALNKKTSPTTPGSGVTNFDILKRLSNLEKHVFGSKINNVDNTIDYSQVNK